MVAKETKPKQEAAKETKAKQPKKEEKKPEEKKPEAPVVAHPPVHSEKPKIDALRIFRELLEMEKDRKAKAQKDEEISKKNRKYSHPAPSVVNRDALVVYVHHTIKGEAPEVCEI